MNTARMNKICALIISMKGMLHERTTCRVEGTYCFRAFLHGLVRMRHNSIRPAVTFPPFKSYLIY